MHALESGVMAENADDRDLNALPREDLVARLERVAKRLETAS
jgi:hypothetical protein